jgi:hypothetical protein
MQHRVHDPKGMQTLQSLLLCRFSVPRLQAAAIGLENTANEKKLQKTHKPQVHRITAQEKRKAQGKPKPSTEFSSKKKKGPSRAVRA